MEDEERNRLEEDCNFWHSQSYQKSVEIASLKEKLENAERKINDYEAAKKSECSSGEFAFGIIIAIFLIGYAGFWIGRWTSVPCDHCKEARLNFKGIIRDIDRQRGTAYMSGWDDCIKLFNIDVEGHYKGASDLENTLEALKNSKNKDKKID